MHQQELIIDSQSPIAPENGTTKPGETEFGALPETPASPAVDSFRSGYRHGPLYGLIAGMGEDPIEYQRMAESLLEDLQPRPGLEAQLVDQMSQALWRMKRAQRMQDGLALQRMHIRREMDALAKAEQATKIKDALKPWERLQAVLARRGKYPSQEEIGEFIDGCKDDPDYSDDFVELLRLTATLTDPLERKSALRRARAHLRDLIEPLHNAAWHFGLKIERASSSENLAALMAPDGNSSATVAQRMEDAQFRRLCRLTQVLSRVRNGALQEKKDVKHSVRSRNVDENKGKPPEAAAE